MWKIFKQEIILKDNFTLKLPEHAKILSVGVQNEIPVFWYQFDSAHKLENRYFHLMLTGPPFQIGTEYIYHGTFMLQEGAFVGHLYEEIMHD